MKIDPNNAIDLIRELVLCEHGNVVLHDGSVTPLAELGEEDCPFRRFCGTLDPNAAFLIAIIPDDADRQVFFSAREVAVKAGLHMQATVDTPAALRRHWENYREMKKIALAESEDSP